jgi:hypothetical protein
MQRPGTILGGTQKANFCTINLGKPCKPILKVKNKTFEKPASQRLMGNIQMQGSRNPEE